MSTWRHTAIKLLPFQKKMIAAAPTPMALWTGLHLEFERWCMYDRLGVARDIMTYARYCWAAPSPEVSTAVAVAFIERLPTKKAVLAILPNYLSVDEVRRLRPILAQHVGDRVIWQLEQTCRRHTAR